MLGPEDGVPEETIGLPRTDTSPLLEHVSVIVYGKVPVITVTGDYFVSDTHRQGQ